MSLLSMQAKKFPAVECGHVVQVLVILGVQMFPKLLAQNLVPWLRRKWNRSRVHVNVTWWERESFKVCTAQRLD